MKNSTKALVAGIAGNILEFYDYLLFGLMLPILSPLFFPSADHFSSLLKGYLLFAAGFFTRPIGSIIFGHIGDKYGRKAALSLSVTLMAIPTTLIGLLPTYETIGIAAPIILSVLRLTQGLCAGGEYNGAGILVTESVSPKSRMFYTAILACSATCGGLLASLVSFLCADLGNISWRVPFIIGGLVGVIGLYLRRNIDETTAFKENVEKTSFYEIISKYSKLCIATMAIGGFAVGPFYFVTAFIPSFLSSNHILSRSEVYSLSVVILSCGIILGVFIGFISKYFSHKRMMYFGCIAVALFAYPFFYLCNSGSKLAIFSACVTLIGLSQPFASLSLGYISSLFPVSMRYRATSLCYTIGVALFCGTIPYISTHLIKTLDTNTAPAIYMIFTALLGMFGVVISNKSYERS